MPDNNAHLNTLHYATPSQRRPRVRKPRQWKDLILAVLGGLLAFTLIAILLFAALILGWTLLEPFGNEPMASGIAGGLFLAYVAIPLSVFGGLYGGLLAALSTKPYLTRWRWSQRKRARKHGASPMEAATRHEQ